MCVIGGSVNVRGDDSNQQAQHHTKKRTSVSLKMAIRRHSCMDLQWSMTR